MRVRVFTLFCVTVSRFVYTKFISCFIMAGFTFRSFTRVEKFLVKSLVNMAWK